MIFEFPIWRKAAGGKKIFVIDWISKLSGQCLHPLFDNFKHASSCLLTSRTQRSRTWHWTPDPQSSQVWACGQPCYKCSSPDTPLSSFLPPCGTPLGLQECRICQIQFCPFPPPWPSQSSELPTCGYTQCFGKHLSCSTQTLLQPFSNWKKAARFICAFVGYLVPWCRGTNLMPVGSSTFAIWSSTRTLPEFWWHQSLVIRIHNIVNPSAQAAKGS